jgi:hypothetical protein
MNTKNKIRLGAAAVVANGLLALVAMAPRPALADSCAGNNYALPCDCSTGACRTIPGCTLYAFCAPIACGTGQLSTACTYS